MRTIQDIHEVDKAQNFNLLLLFCKLQLLLPNWKYEEKQGLNSFSYIYMNVIVRVIHPYRCMTHTNIHINNI